MTTATPRSGPRPAPPPARAVAPPPRVDPASPAHSDTADGPRFDRVPMTGASRSCARWRRSAARSSSGSPAARSCRPTTPCWTRRACGTSSSATSRARATPPPGTRRPSGGSGCAWPRRGRGRPTSSPRSPTRTWTRSRSSRSPASRAGALIGTDAFQEADITGITMPITKHNMLVTDAAEIPRAIAEAFHLASTGRPGPVLVDIPKDVLQEQTTFSWPPELRLPGYRPTTRPHGKQIREAAKLINQAHRPVLYVGGGVLKAEASAELRALAELTNIPVVTTLMARGVFPDSHPQHVGMPGMHGTVAAVAAMQKADLLVALGARFDDRVTGQLASFAPHAQVVHADIDPAEISKNRRADVPIVGDCREAIVELIDAVTVERVGHAPADLTPWWAELDQLRATYPLGYDWPTDGSLSPQYVIERIGAIAGPDAVYTAGVGQHQMWAAQFVKYEKPRSWINSGGLGTMGFAVPAAMGVKMARPDTVVWAIDGDGCFQMTNQELATCAIEGIPIKVAIINNGNLGMVRQWQNLFYAGRYSQTDLGTHKHRIPDFKLLAEAMGCVGLRAESREDVDRVIEQAMAIDDRPVVVDFVVGADAQVWPMVASGTGNSEIMAARGVRPLFDGDELSADVDEVAAVTARVQDESAAEGSPQEGRS